MAVVFPYVRAATWADGSTTDTAAKRNTIEDGIFNAHQMPTVKATRSTTQSLTSSVWTLLLWDTETGGWDTAGGAASTMHSTSVNTGRLIAQFAGKYQVVLFTNWASNTTGIRVGVIQKNSEALPATTDTGVYQGGYAISAPSAGITLSMSATAIVDLAVNDYVAAVAFQSSGGALTIGTDSYFAMTRIA